MTEVSLPKEPALAQAFHLNCNGKILDLTTPKVMGVVNVTPDSFSGDGVANSIDVAVAKALEFEKQGAAIIDIGGESTQPYATAIDTKTELQRVLPVIEELQGKITIPLSIDTSNPVIMAEAIKRGVGMVNDIRAFNHPDAFATVKKYDVAIAIMHMQGTPGTMQSNPFYHNVTSEIYSFLASRLDAAIGAGICKKRILIDPGFGFGKNLNHNLTLLKNLERFKTFKVPLLVGISRKAMLGEITAQAPADRVFATIAVHTIALLNGANLIRVHDVAAAIDGLKVVHSYMKGLKHDS